MFTQYSLSGHRNSQFALSGVRAHRWRQAAFFLLAVLVPPAIPSAIGQAVARVGGSSAAPTATTLTVSSNNVVAGTVVILTASVIDPAPVTRGTILFCDASVSQCTQGRGLYGSAQLTSAGSAALKYRFAVGVANVRAQFVATNKNQSSVSTISSIGIGVGAEPIYTSSTSLTSAGTSGNYTLSGSITRFGTASSQPSVSILDTTNGNVQIGSAALGTPVPSFAAIVKYDGVGFPRSVAVADFNEDGLPDMVAVDANGNSVSVLLGNADGTFYGLKTYAAGTFPSSVAVGDFNGDGISDVIVTSADNTVSVLLGNGDGTFQGQKIYAAGNSPSSIAVADLDGDGIPDVVLTNYYAGTVSVLLGNGDGTFQGRKTYAVGYSSSSVAAADLNRDGIPDLIVANSAEGVSVLLGNGDGSFQDQKQYAAGTFPDAIAVADFNGDGILDVVVADKFDSTLSVLLGNGDGTFQDRKTYAAGNYSTSIAVADFNGDGIPDVLVSNFVDNTVSVVLGNGDGTFQAQKPYAVGTTLYGVATADFNGDGIPDVVVGCGDSTVSVLLGNQRASFSVSKINVSGTNGTHTVLAAWSGDGLNAPSQSSNVSLEASSRVTPVLAWSTPSAITYGTALSAAQLNATSGGVTGVFTYSPVLTTVLSSGTQRLSATFTPTDLVTYTTASATVALTVMKATPIMLTWPTASPINYGQMLASSTLSGGSGPIAGTMATLAGNGAYDFTGDGGAATRAAMGNPTSLALDRDGNTYLGDGNNRIRKVTAATGMISTVAGNGSYGFSGDGGAATSAAMTNPGGIALDSTGNIYFTDSTNNRVRKVTVSSGIIITVAGNGTGGGSGDGGPATSAMLHDPNGLTLDREGNIYIADFSNNRIRKVTVSTGIITTVAGDGTNNFAGDGSAATSAGVNLPFGVALDSAENIYIADMGSSRIRMVTVSTGIITTVAGNGSSGFSGDGGAATSAMLASPHGVAVDSLGNIFIADLSNNIRLVTVSTGIITTVAVHSSGGLSGNGGAANNALNFPIGLALDSMGNIYIADLTNNRIQIVFGVSIPGSFSWTAPSTIPTVGISAQGVTFTPTDTTNYTTVSGLANVSTTSQSQTIFFSPPTSPVIYGVVPIRLTATATSGLDVTFSIVSGPATVAGNRLTTTGVGAVVIAADEAGDSNYLPASQVTQTVVVNQASQEITFAPPPTPVPYGVDPISLSATGGGSGAPILFTVASGPGTISPSTLTIDRADGNIPYRMVAQGSYLYISSQGGGGNGKLAIVDISSPTSPALLSLTTGVSTSMNGIGVQGNFLFVTYYGNSEIQSWNVSKPGAPVALSTASVCSRPFGGMVINGNYAYIPCPNVGGTGQISVVDISNPAAMLVVGTVTALTGTNPTALSVQNNVLYMNNPSEGQSYVSAYSLSDPASPELIGQAAVGHSPQYVTAMGAIVLATIGDAAQTASIDFSNPSSPVVSPLNGPCASFTENTIYSAENYALVACNTSGFYLVERSNKAALSVVGSIGSWIADPTQILVLGQHVYVGSEKASTLSVFTWVLPTLMQTSALEFTGRVNINGVGSVIVTANQAGNMNYSAAAPVQQTITVNQASQTITFPAPASPVAHGVAPILLSATATSGLQVVFSVVAGPATIVGNTMEITGPGRVTIAADQTGNSDYSAALQVTRSVTVICNNAAITIDSSAHASMLGSPTALTATLATAAGTPTGPVGFLDGSTPLGSAFIIGNLASLVVSNLAAGTHTFTAVYAGDLSFNPATSTPITQLVVGFSLSSGNGAKQSARPGGSVTYALDIVPTSGNFLPAVTTLTVTGVPDGAAVSITPSAWTQLTPTSWNLPANTPLSSISMNLRLAPAIAADTHRKPIGGLAMAFLCLLLMPFGRRRSKNGRRLHLGTIVLSMLTVAVGSMALLGLTGCGSIITHAPYSTVVTATAGTLSRSTTLTLTVE